MSAYKMNKRRRQCSRVVRAPRTSMGGNCCNYYSNYDARSDGWRCRVCGIVYEELPQ